MKENALFALLLAGVIALMAYAQCDDSDLPQGPPPGRYQSPTERQTR